MDAKIKKAQNNWNIYLQLVENKDYIYSLQRWEVSDFIDYCKKQLIKHRVFAAETLDLNPNMNLTIDQLLHRMLPAANFLELLPFAENYYQNTWNPKKTPDQTKKSIQKENSHRPPPEPQTLKDIWKGTPDQFTNLIKKLKVYQNEIDSPFLDNEGKWIYFKKGFIKHLAALYYLLIINGYIKQFNSGEMAAMTFKNTFSIKDDDLKDYKPFQKITKNIPDEYYLKTTRKIFE